MEALVLDNVEVVFGEKCLTVAGSERHEPDQSTRRSTIAYRRISSMDVVAGDVDRSHWEHPQLKLHVAGARTYWLMFGQTADSFPTDRQRCLDVAARIYREMERCV
jgi:hypothetical protein